jgi:hypothetical protein
MSGLGGGRALIPDSAKKLPMRIIWKGQDGLSRAQLLPLRNKRVSDEICRAPVLDRRL